MALVSTFIPSRHCRTTELNSLPPANNSALGKNWTVQIITRFQKWFGLISQNKIPSTWLLSRLYEALTLWRRISSSSSLLVLGWKKEKLLLNSKGKQLKNNIKFQCCWQLLAWPYYEQIKVFNDIVGLLSFVGVRDFLTENLTLVAKAQSWETKRCSYDPHHPKFRKLNITHTNHVLLSTSMSMKMARSWTIYQRPGKRLARPILIFLRS